jgi:monoterpene epsilon-lactone hydrolase
MLGILVVTFFTTLAARLRRGPARPAWGFQFEWVVAFLRKDFEDSARWPYARLRRDLDARRYPSKALAQVTREPTSLGGVPAVWFRPMRPRRGAILLLHGGSYIFGSIRTSHAGLAASLALLAGVAVVGIDYRLAPEHPYPAALDDALRAFDALLQSGLSASEIVVAGDSAGGNLALALQLSLRDRKREQARAALLLSPWLDLTASHPSCRAADRLDYGQTSFLLKHARDFAGGIALDDPRVSPLNASLAGLAPLLVVIGGAERLADEGRALVVKARAAGVSAELFVAEDMPHNPVVLADFHPNAAHAQSAAAQFATQMLDTAP